MEVPKTVNRDCRMAALPTCQEVLLHDTTDEIVDIYETCRLPLGNTDCIRLLEFCSTIGTDSQRISCRLSLASTHDPYIALSYVWGDPTDTQEILVNERPFRVGRNLLNFLRQARIEEANDRTTRQFWVDALCINQAVILEKNHQVGNMGKIYSNAAFVLVWLGADQEHVQ